MLISINTANIKPSKYTKDINKAKDKTLAHIKKIVIKNIYYKGYIYKREYQRT
jgi:hypothetical protein